MIFFLLIQMSIIWIYIIMFGLPAIFHDKNFSIGHYRQSFQPNLFMIATSIGTIDFQCSVPLSMTLSLAGGHKVSA